MKFGLMSMFSDSRDVPQERVFLELFEEVEFAEALGFDSVWLPEHHFSRDAVDGTLRHICHPSPERILNWTF
jgi:alkanesulfonate monooxygenase SsuD/methylene tetrahydromethanopterin reductase-like flavin-dependent oxidoreductase (luciferase family)